MGFHLKYLLLYCLVCTLTQLSNAEENLLLGPSVHVRQGLISGLQESSLGGVTFYSYMSIPYAKPPLNELRFKEPIPMDSWEGVKDGTKKPPLCLQYNPFEEVLPKTGDSEVQGNEDCLFLNVFTAKPNKEDAGLPVMAYIHGGGFLCGGAEDASPHVLLSEDVVLVAIQYRLGVMGFLSTEDSTLPGNNGLKDQRLALQWIQENIRQFGGDPNKITLFGESAGAASVHMHMLSPGSKGLFHRAILQSGTSFCPWATNQNHRQFAEEMGETFECPLADGTESYVKCMQNIGAKFLMEFSQRKIKWIISPSYVLPRVDGEFFPASPEILVQEGKYNKVNAIIGINRDEGGFLSILMRISPQLWESLKNNFEEIGPISLYLQTQNQHVHLARRIYEHYINKIILNLTPEDEESLMRLYSDRYFSVCYDSTAILHAKDEDMSLYLYELNHLGEGSVARIFPNMNSSWVSHVDDLFYLFQGWGPFQFTLQRPEDLKMRDIIVSLWVNFATTGDPNIPGSDFTWEKATSNDFRHLSLTPNPQMENDKREETRKFWYSLGIHPNIDPSQARKTDENSKVRGDEL